MPVVASDVLLPSDREDDLDQVCPSCRQPIAAFHDLPPPSGTIRKCPQHGLAFVERHELAAGDGDPLLGTTIAGRFTVLGRLGRGSMGSVYRARQEAVGRDVALKIVRRDRAYDPETKARFEREARAISSLTSPHTITAFDFGESDDGSWFLAMEMLEGETVGERLRREQRLDWLDATRFARDALKALAEAHSKGIIHRDLKPDNLFLVRLPEAGGRRQEICKVLDFGIAKWQGGNETAIDQLETQAGTVFGTPRYMSPEQAQGSALDARSDLYSLGVLLYQMLSGRAPFVDDDAVVVMARHIKDAPLPLSEVAAAANIPAALEAAVFKALAKSPDDRPQSAEQMSSELERAVETTQAIASGVQPAQLAPEASKRSSALRGLVLVAITGLAVLGAAVAATHLHRAPTPEGEIVAPRLLPPTVASTAVSQPVNDAPALPEATADQAESAENSSSTAASASAARGAPRLRVARPRSSAPSSVSLPRKGNERYGRFE
jgi:tRNA A-37 threonylcarbamoyl transferase component Bud32